MNVAMLAAVRQPPRSLGRLEKSPASVNQLGKALLLCTNWRKKHMQTHKTQKQKRYNTPDRSERKYGWRWVVSQH